MDTYLILGAAIALLLVSLYAARAVWRVVWQSGQSLSRVETGIAEGRSAAQEEFEKIASQQRALSDSVVSVRQDLARQEESARRIQVALDASTQRIQEALDASSAGLSRQLADIRANLPPPKPQYEDPIPFIETMAEADVLRLAEGLAFVRPLVPYPNWHFDVDWPNADLGYRLRRSIWTYFCNRRSTPALDIPWYRDLKLRLYLGNDHSKQLFIASCFEPNEFALLNKLLKPGMVFVDAGANEGYFTVFAARWVGESGAVWAFEPSRREMEYLTANIGLNGLANVRTFPIALADEDAHADLLVAADEHCGHNTLGQFVYESELARHESVPLRRLDSLLQENPLERLDFLKMDVEGAEMRLLTGARETLRRFRPMILFEVNDRSLKQQGGSGEALIQFLESQAYRLYLFNPATGLPMAASRGCCGDNMLAVPMERALPESALLPLPAA